MKACRKQSEVIVSTQELNSNSEMKGAKEQSKICPAPEPCEVLEEEELKADLEEELNKLNNRKAIKTNGSRSPKLRNNNWKTVSNTSGPADDYMALCISDEKKSSRLLSKTNNIECYLNYCGSLKPLKPNFLNSDDEVEETKETTKEPSCLDIKDKTGCKISEILPSGKENPKDHLRKSKEGIFSQVFKNEQGHLLGYLSGRLSGVCGDAGRYLQTTKDVIRQVRNRDTQVFRSLCQSLNANLTKQLPFLQKAKPLDIVASSTQPEPKKRVHFREEPNDELHYDVSDQSSCLQECQNAAGSFENSVKLCKSDSAKVFCQRLGQFPNSLLDLQSLPLDEMLEHLSKFAPELRTLTHTLKGVFWLRLANNNQPTPQNGVLLLFQEVIYAFVISDGTRHKDQLLIILHRLGTLQITEIQVGLAGEHVRILGDANDATLVVLTNSQILTQELCLILVEILDQALVKEKRVLCHPLLNSDLVGLSLDWSSNVPDLVLNDNVKISTRFKRVLADLVYVLHGNMDSPKPSLANLQLLTYTNVRVEQSRQDGTRLPPDSCLPVGSLAQFVLTDTHLGLIHEDAVFYPMPRYSTAVPSRPQFEVTKLRRHSEVKCLIVKDCESCVKIEIVFKAQVTDAKKADHKTKQFQKNGLPEVWNLAFGCAKNAANVVSYLCV